MRSVWIALGVAGLSMAALGWKPQDEAAQPEFYTTKVMPILETSCYRCHGGEAHRGGFNMNTRAALLKGGHHGPAVIPGDPAKSFLVVLIRHARGGDDPMPMPPSPRPKLSDADIATVERWIRAGAVMPDSKP